MLIIVNFTDVLNDRPSQTQLQLEGIYSPVEVRNDEKTKGYQSLTRS